MTRTSLRAAAIVAAGAIAAGCGTDAVTAPAVAPSLSLAAAGSPIDAGVASLTLRPGETHQLSATKVANDRPAPGVSVRWHSDDAAVASVSADGLVAAVAPGTATVTLERGAHRVPVQVTVVDPCTVGVLALGVTTGEITADDCLFPFAGRRSDYYGFTPAAGEVVLLQTSGVDGIAGVKQATANVHEGTVFGSRNVGATFRVIGNGDPVHFYLSGRDSTKLGAYSVTRSTSADAYRCGVLTFVMPGASFAADLTVENTCLYTVQFSPAPEAIGQPIRTHAYWVRLDEVRPYTVTLGGLHANFDPALTIFPNVAGGAPVAQSVPGAGPSPASRSVTFTPPAPGYYMIEVASGRWTNGAWAVETDDYTLGVTR